jgi:hypothetical protein
VVTRVTTSATVSTGFVDAAAGRLVLSLVADDLAFAIYECLLLFGLSIPRKAERRVADGASYPQVFAKNCNKTVGYGVLH